MGWSATRVHVRSEELEKVAESFRNILYADDARPASVDEDDSGVERYQVLRQVGSPWVTIARRFLDVQPTVADQLARELHTTGLSLVVHNSDVAFLRIIKPATPEVTVEFPVPAAKRSDALHSLRTVIDNRVSDDELLTLLAERPIGVELVLRPLLLHADLPESQSIDVVEAQQMEVIDVSVRVKDAPSIELATGAPILSGFGGAHVSSISGWPIEQSKPHVGFQNNGGPFNELHLEFTDDGRPAVEISSVRISKRSSDLSVRPDAVAPIADSMTIPIYGAAATVERFPTKRSITPAFFDVWFEGVAGAPGTATISLKVSLNGGMHLPLEVAVTVLDEGDVPLPFVRDRTIPLGADSIRRTADGADVAVRFTLSRRLEPDEYVPILKRWIGMPGVGDGPFSTFAVKGVRSLRGKDIGKSKKWQTVADALASLISFSLTPAESMRPFGHFSVLQPRPEKDRLGQVSIALVCETPADQTAAKESLVALGDFLAEQGLVSQGSVVVPRRVPYMGLLGSNMFPAGRDPSRDLIVEPAQIMWLTPDVVARTDRPLNEIGTLEPVGSMTRFVAAQPELRPIELAVESLLPPLQFPG